MPTDPDLVEVRRAAPEDTADLTALYLETRAASVPAMPPPVHSDGEVREWMHRQVETKECWLALEGGVVEGFVTLDETWLDDLYVRPSAQRRGLGAMLLDLAVARRPGGFCLWVFADNQPARRFYRAHGLVELEQTDGSENEERAPDVRMAWPGERPLEFLRARIDEVDDQLAVLLARRTALTAAVQEHKRAAGTAAGQQGRDAKREAEIAERMSEHAPGLGADRIGRVMRVLIAESLESWENGRD